MQVTRGDLIVFFNEIFDALCKLSADSDPSVQNAAHLMDRLVKVSTCVYKSLNFQKLFFMESSDMSLWHVWNAFDACWPHQHVSESIAALLVKAHEALSCFCQYLHI